MFCHLGWASGPRTNPAHSSRSTEALGRALDVSEVATHLPFLSVPYSLPLPSAYPLSFLVLPSLPVFLSSFFCFFVLCFIHEHAVMIETGLAAVSPSENGAESATGEAGLIQIV